MIQRLSHASLYVLDQDRALAFYTEKLGFDVRADVRMGSFRWLTVGPKGQPDLEIILMPLSASPMLDEATVGTARGLL
ncbi:MAG TPA: VOC family protein, partial [Kofleriaceae bacterium]|nr:VOC family protein [Kofleriaceae bacterium]